MSKLAISFMVKLSILSSIAELLASMATPLANIKELLRKQP